MAWKGDVFQYLWDHFEVTASPSFALIQRIFGQMLVTFGLGMIHDSMLALVGMVSRSTVPALRQAKKKKKKKKLPWCWNLVMQWFHLSLDTLNLHVCMLSIESSDRNTSHKGLPLVNRWRFLSSDISNPTPISHEETPYGDFAVLSLRGHGDGISL